MSRAFHLIGVLLAAASYTVGVVLAVRWGLI
jgi:hypothetical protein